MYLCAMSDQTEPQCYITKYTMSGFDTETRTNWLTIAFLIDFILLHMILCFFYIVLYFFLQDDVFGIDEVTLHKGEWNDKVYAVAGDVLDGVSIIV